MKKFLCFAVLFLISSIAYAVPSKNVSLNKTTQDSTQKTSFTDDKEEELCSLIRYMGKGLSEAEIEQAMGVGLLNTDNQWERAQSHFKKAVELDPKLYQAWYNLGLIHVNDEEGMGYFRKAIEVKPDYAPSYYWMAYYYTRYGKFKEALPLWEKYLDVAKVSKDEEGRIEVATGVVKEIRDGKPGKELGIIHIH